MKNKKFNEFKRVTEEMCCNFLFQYVGDGQTVELEDFCEKVHFQKHTMRNYLNREKRICSNQSKLRIALGIGIFIDQILPTFQKKANLEGCDACARRLFYEEFRKCFGTEANYVIYLIENKDDLEQEATEIYKELARKTNHLNEIKKNGK